MRTPSDRQGDVPVLNIANALTLLRILLIPVFVWVFFHDPQSAGWRWCAFGVFALAMVTDKLDGDLARRYGLITNVGKIADPIADKGQMAAALLSLSLVGELWWWVTIVILVREIGITVWRFTQLSERVIPASRGGKVKTVLQTAALSLFLVPLPPLLVPLAWLVMAAAFIVTGVTGIDYLWQARQLRRSASASRVP